MSGFERFSRKILHLDTRTVQGPCLARYKSVLQLFKGKKVVQLFEAKENEVTAEWKSSRCWGGLGFQLLPLAGSWQSVVGFLLRPRQAEADTDESLKDTSQRRSWPAGQCMSVTCVNHIWWRRRKQAL